MKRFTQLLTLAVFCSMMVLISCKKKDGTTKTDIRDAAGEALNKTWVYQEVRNEDLTRVEWSGFAISITYNEDTDIGSYQVTGVPADNGATDVWGENVTWQFNGTEDSPDVASITVTRGDGTTVLMNVSSSETELVLTFTIPDPDARVAGFDGNWEFTLTAQ